MDIVTLGLMSSAAMWTGIHVTAITERDEAELWGMILFVLGFVGLMVCLNSIVADIDRLGCEMRGGYVVGCERE